MANKKDKVYMRPSEIRYSQGSIRNTFKDGTKIGELLDDLYYGRCLVSDIKRIEVAHVSGQWYSADNRRLWVFKTMKSVGKLERVHVKVIKKIPQGKMTTKDDGVAVRIRGDDPGGDVWEAIQELDKENVPKKRKRRRKRGKKKNKQAVDSNRVSDTCKTVDKPDTYLGETQSSENTDECENGTTYAGVAISLATLQELNSMLKNMESFGQTDIINAPPEGVPHYSSDESDKQLEVDCGETEDTPDTQENDYGEEEFPYESMYESSEDEYAAKCAMQTSPPKGHITGSTVEAHSSSGAPTVNLKSKVGNVIQISRSVTNKTHNQAPGSLTQWQREQNNLLLQQKCVQNVPVIVERENGYNTIQQRRNADIRPGNGAYSNRNTILQWMEDSDVTTSPPRRANRVPDTAFDTHMEPCHHRTPLGHYDVFRDELELSLGKALQYDWLSRLESRYPSAHGDSRKPYMYESEESVASISESDIINSAVVENVGPKDTLEAKVHVPCTKQDSMKGDFLLGKFYDKVSGFLSSVFNKAGSRKETLPLL